MTKEILCRKIEIKCGLLVKNISKFMSNFLSMHPVQTDEQ